MAELAAQGEPDEAVQIDGGLLGLGEPSGFGAVAAAGDLDVADAVAGDRLGAGGSEHWARSARRPGEHVGWDLLVAVVGVHDLVDHISDL